MYTIATTFLLALLLHTIDVNAHGFLLGMVADGVYYPGYNPIVQSQPIPPALSAWSIPKDSNRGFVNAYMDPDIICHLRATQGQAYATVAAGGRIDFQWTVWPSDHHGPVLSYLANCKGECTKVAKRKLLWNKIDEAGLVNDAQVPGIWATDIMIRNNNTWTLTIPPTIAPGNYVLRHEIIALHAAGQVASAQHYPQCVNLKITGNGSNKLTTGTHGTSLYRTRDPGVFINIYQPLAKYPMPGPALIGGAVAPVLINNGSSNSNQLSSASTAIKTTLQTVTRTSSSENIETIMSQSLSESLTSSTLDANVVKPVATVTGAADGIR